MADPFRYPSFDNFKFFSVAPQKGGSLREKGVLLETMVFNRDVFRFRIVKDHQPYRNHSQERIGLTPAGKQPKNPKFGFQTAGKPPVFKIRKQGKTILSSLPGIAGLNGERIIYAFQKRKNQPFWGFGEKTGGMNKEGKSLKMWNVDVMCDHSGSFSTDAYDPAYVSIPFFITKVSGQFVGFYLDNPGETFFDLGKTSPDTFFFGSYSGASDLYVIPGESIRDVLSRFHDLTGRMEMPPVWSLGYHQCRWSYMDAKEVERVVQGYEKEGIPLSAIWLDIDYMEGYRVFTWNKKRFPDPAGLIGKFRKKGVRLVTIVDPGVKKDPEYPVYKEGKKKDLFCKTFNGNDYVGYVWPGKTLFPDFSLEKAQEWWAGHIAKFVDAGVSGIWNDMNDPSTGDAEREDMLFQHGSAAHNHYHNQYGTLMAKATKRGLDKANPTQRSFILTRSASAGIQKYAAVWTGDNASNWSHLRMSIPESVNLSLSGVSFNGPDVGGFAGDTTPLLITRWHQAGFLFPFFRNHSAWGTKNQEVYQFEKKHKDVMKKFILLRYRLLPYLYDCFFFHRAHSDPVLRPLFYEFDDEKYYGINDQFMVGPFLMQAPLLTETDKRDVQLPPGYWYDYFAGKWIKGGRTISVKCGLSDTKMYIRDGAIVPMRKTGDAGTNWSSVEEDLEFHLFFKEKKKASTYHYHDDGETSGYLKGKFDLFAIQAEWRKGLVVPSINVIRRQFTQGKRTFVFKIAGTGIVIRKEIS